MLLRLMTQQSNQTDVPGASASGISSPRKIAPQIWAGTAPGIDPGRIRLYMDGDIYEEVIASITPSNARALAKNLMHMADFIEEYGI